MDAFMGMIVPVAFNYAPRGWMFCNGQTVPIAQNSALFSLLGTMYGGDGQITFGLPDLRGRVPVGSQGAGPGIANVVQGEMAGSNNVTVLATGAATVTLATANLPAHTHTASIDPTAIKTTLEASTGTTGTSTSPANGSFLSASPGGPGSASIYCPTVTGPVNLGGVSTAAAAGAVTVGSTGSGQPLQAPVQTNATVSIMQPYLGLNYIICAQGIFPSRN